jgi:surface protein
MLGMFYGEPAFNFNSNISNWDVSSVTDMQGMFAGVSTFNSDISNWDVSSVTNMYYMFGGASSFNQNLCPWGPKLPSNFNYGNANDMFYSSGCASTTNPTGPSGPWCAASCS